MEEIHQAETSGDVIPGTPRKLRRSRPGPACSKAVSGASTPASGRSRSPIVSGAESTNNICADARGKRPRTKGSSSDADSVSPRARSTRKRFVADSSSESENEDDVPTASTVAPRKSLEELKREAKGKRGRPPTTGEYCGLSKAKTELLELKARELDMRMEKEVAARLFNATGSFPKRGEGTIAEVPTVDLASSADEAATAVEQVAKKSRNLKGGCVKQLKMAAQVVRMTVDELVHRVYAASADKNEDPVSVSSEMDRVLKKLESLEQENSRLKKEIEALKQAALPPPAGISGALPPKEQRRPRTRAAPTGNYEDFPCLPPPAAMRTEMSPPPTVAGMVVSPWCQRYKPQTEVK